MHGLSENINVEISCNSSKLTLVYGLILIIFDLGSVLGLSVLYRWRLYGAMAIISMGLNGIAVSQELYRWVDSPKDEAIRITEAENRLQQAIRNPEYVLNQWIDLPASPNVRHKKPLQLSLREAILLALRYNSNIQMAELDRIIQRYQLRLAENEFELQYALAGSAAIEKTRFSGIGSGTNQNYLATPELKYKNPLGTQVNLSLDHNVSNYNSFMPVLNFTVTQPLLRGFGKDINQAQLFDAKDNEWLNKLNLQQTLSDQITHVITAYRSLILSGNSLLTQKLQLKEARNVLKINAKKIKSGQLEPTGNIQQAYQVESLNLMVTQAENEFETAAQDLLQIIGLDPNLHLTVPDNVEVGEIIIPDRHKALRLAYSHNTQYLAQQVLLRADERAYKVAKNQQLWQLDLGANVQTGSVTDVEGTRGFPAIYNGRNISETARLTLTIPINDLNRRSQLINAKVRLEKDRLTLIALRRTLETTITNTINTILSQAKRYQLAQKQVILAAQSYELEKKKFQAGIASSLDVNNTQNQLIQAQSNLISAKVAYLNQISGLERILGTTLQRWNINLRYQ